MLKGVNRQVVEIPQPESAYFEKVIFFVKPEFSEISETKIRSSAHELIKNASPPPRGKAVGKRGERIRFFVKVSLAALSGAAVTALGMLIIF